MPGEKALACANGLTRLVRYAMLFLVITCLIVLQEFGFFQTTDSKNQPFGDLVPLSYYTDMCNDIFGFDWDPRIDDTNTYYGALDPRSTRVVFVNGSVDPWHTLSILESQSESLLAIFIEGTAHCANMKPAMPYDPPGLAKAQQQTAQILHEWIHN